jgi:hypothetical protein
MTQYEETFPSTRHHCPVFFCAASMAALHGLLVGAKKKTTPGKVSVNTNDRQCAARQKLELAFIFPISVERNQSTQATRSYVFGKSPS